MEHTLAEFRFMSSLRDLREMNAFRAGHVRPSVFMEESCKAYFEIHFMNFFRITKILCLSLAFIIKLSVQYSSSLLGRGSALYIFLSPVFLCIFFISVLSGVLLPG